MHEQTKQQWALANADTLRAANAAVIELTQYLNVSTSSEVLQPIATRLRDLLATVTDSPFDAEQLSTAYRRAGESFGRACEAMDAGKAKDAGSFFELALHQFQDASALLADLPPPEPPKIPVYKQGAFWVGVVVAITVLFLIF